MENSPIQAVKPIVKGMFIKGLSRPGVSELSKRYNVSQNTIKNWIRKESWREERLMFWEKHTTKVLEALDNVNETFIKSLDYLARVGIQQHVNEMARRESNRKQKIAKAIEEGVDPNSIVSTPYYSLAEIDKLKTMLEKIASPAMMAENKREITLKISETRKASDNQLLEALSSDEKEDVIDMISDLDYKVLPND